MIDIDTRMKVLQGSDLPELGVTRVWSVDDGLACALSRGRHAKGYPHVDPNEDAVLVARGPAGTLLAVLDGHNGYDAAGAAADALADAAPRAVDLGLDEAGLTAILRGARAAVDSVVSRLDAPRHASRTALTIAYVTAERVLHATAGDTALLAVGRRPKLWSRPGPWFGPGYRLPEVQTQRRKRETALVLASDGLTGFVGHGWERRASSIVAAQPPSAAVSGLVDLAGAHGAGDNVAIAVLTL